MILQILSLQGSDAALVLSEVVATACGGPEIPDSASFAPFLGSGIALPFQDFFGRFAGGSLSTTPRLRVGGRSRWTFFLRRSAQLSSCGFGFPLPEG